MAKKVGDAGKCVECAAPLAAIARRGPRQTRCGNCYDRWRRSENARCARERYDRGRTQRFCRVCGVPLPKRRSTTCPAHRGMVLFLCTWCGVEAVVNRQPRRLVCSIACDIARRRATMRPRTSAEERRLRNRARDMLEAVWRSGACGICGRAVSRKHAYPHPLSASVDHIIPVAIGGATDIQNLQLAHLCCNHRKGAAVVAAQIPLAWAV